MLNVGDSVGMLRKITKLDGTEEWKLVEDKINKITTTKKYGRRYFVESKFNPLDADDVDSNTRIMENLIGKGNIFTNEVFGLNDKTRPVVENFVKWMNLNINTLN